MISFLDVQITSRCVFHFKYNFLATFHYHLNLYFIVQSTFYSVDFLNILNFRLLCWIKLLRVLILSPSFYFLLSVIHYSWLWYTTLGCSLVVVFAQPWELMHPGLWSSFPIVVLPLFLLWFQEILIKLVKVSVLTSELGNPIPPRYLNAPQYLHKLQILGFVSDNTIKNQSHE